MSDFATKRLPAARTTVAPDGSDVRVLLGLPRGSLAHFELAPGETAAAVAHRTVEEIWFFLRGRGEMWRKLGEHEDVAPVEAGVCLTIPLGTRFQFRSLGPEPLAAVAVTMPPWPGPDEAYAVPGKWAPTVRPPRPSRPAAMPPGSGTARRSARGAVTPSRRRRGGRGSGTAGGRRR